MLKRFDPWRELFTLRDEIEHIFDRFFGETLPVTREEVSWYPALDMYETDNELVIKAELPGIESKDVDITLSDNTLTIKGERKKSEEVKGENYYRREVSYGSFQRAVNLPVSVNTEKIKATFKNGILEIKLEKEKPAKGIKIDIKEEK